MWMKSSPFMFPSLKNKHYYFHLGTIPNIFGVVNNERSTQHWAYFKQIFFDFLILHICLLAATVYIGIKCDQLTREWYPICVGESNHQCCFVLLWHILGKLLARDNLWVSSKPCLDKLCTLMIMYCIVHLLSKHNFDCITFTSRHSICQAQSRESRGRGEGEGD